MSLLELCDVSRRASRRAGDRLVLDRVSLCVEAGEAVGVWGRRRSGRSTLLRIAAGLEAPDDGRVFFDGEDLTTATTRGRGGLRFCRKRFRAVDGESVADQLVTSQLVCGVSTAIARGRAREALERLGVHSCASMRPTELDPGEQVLVAVARSLTHDPRLLVIDEPTLGVEILERDDVMGKLRSLRADGVSLLISAGETASLTGVDRVLSIAGGVVRGETSGSDLAPVFDLRGHRASSL